MSEPTTREVLVLASCERCHQLGPVLLTQLPMRELWSIPPRYWCSWACFAQSEASK